MSRHNSLKYVPAMGYHSLTRFYDPLAAWGLNDRALKGELIRQAMLIRGQRILDVGSGTGTLAFQIGENVSGVFLVGLDVDEEMIDRAAARAKDAQAVIHFTRASAAELPVGDASFDRVLSSLVFHHLSHEERSKAFGRIYDVLKPGGELHYVDWTKPASIAAAAGFYVVRVVDGVARTSDNASGQLSRMLEDSGFAEVRTRRVQNTILGTLAFCSAVKAR